MSIPYLRFRPGLAGVDRQYELKNLRALGVVSLKRAFFDDHPDRAAVYVIATRDDDRTMLDAYLKDSTGILSISHEQYAELRDAPMPRAAVAGAIPAASRPATAKTADTVATVEAVAA